MSQKARRLTLICFLLPYCLAQRSFARSIEGTVQDASHAVIRGAVVTAIQGNTSRAVTTGLDGSFSFSRLSDRELVLMVQANGFAPFRQPIATGTGDVVLSVVLQPQPVETQIVVTASRTALPLDDTPQDVQVLSAPQLLTSGALEVDDLLREYAGFDTFRRASNRTANPTSEGVSFRGLASSGASRASVLLDGVPIADPFGGWVNWSQIPRATVDSVEMLEGGASDLYGGQALSGALQLLTKTPQVSQADLDLSYGNERTPNGSVYLGRDFGRWLVSGAGEYFRTDGYILIDPAQRGGVDLPANSLHRNGDFNLQRLFSQRSRIFAGARAYDDSRNSGLPQQTNRTRSWTAITGLDWSWPGGDLFQFRGYGGAEDFHQTFVAASANRRTAFLTRAQTVPSRAWGLSAQYSRPLATSNTVLAGVEASSITGESDDQLFTTGKPSSLANGGGRERTAGVFVEDLAHISSRWLLTAAVRFDSWETIQGFSRSVTLPSFAATLTRFPDRSEFALNPKLAGKYQLSGKVALRGSVNRAFRSPTLNELYRSFRLGNILTLANPQLRSERLTGWEAGLDEKLWEGKLRLSESFFWADVHRPIANVTQSATSSLITRLRQNLGSTRSRGFNLRSEWSVAKWTSVMAQYQFADAIVTSFPADRKLAGLRVPQVPRHEFTFQMQFANPRVLTGAVQARSSSSQFDDDQNLFPLGSYFKLDAFVSRRLTAIMDVYVAGENLLDDRYMIARTPIVSVGPPLLARVGIQLHLRR